MEFNLRVILQKKGLDIGNNDTLIAAIVLENGKKIITDNRDHFSRIDDLEVIYF